MDNREFDLLLAQYKAVSDQLIHWDTFYWTKSTFFFAVESIALLGIGKWILDRTGAGESLCPSIGLLYTFVVATILNLFLCAVWLRTGIRNREYLNMRFELGIFMEEYVENTLTEKYVEKYGRHRPAFCLYTYNHWKSGTQLKSLKSHILEILIPAAFAIVWVIIIIYIFTYAPTLTAIDYAILGVAALGTIFFISREVYYLKKATPPEAGKGQAESKRLWAEFQEHCDKRPPRADA